MVLGQLFAGVAGQGQLRPVPVSPARASCTFNRRDVLFAQVASWSVLQARSVRAEVDEATLFTDSAGWTIRVPRGWQSGQGSASALNKNESRRVTAWYPDPANPGRASVSVLVTNVAADFTTLGSFGTASAFGETLVNGLDRSYLRRQAWGRKPEDVQEARLVEAREQDGGDESAMYRIEYLLRRPGQEETRIWELVALRFDGTFNRLYTVTAQCLESERSIFEGAIADVLGSFRAPRSVAGLAMR